MTLFSAELPWCCFMCRKQIFSERPETPRNILQKIIKNPRQRWTPGGPHPSHEGGGAPPPRARPRPRGHLVASSPPTPPPRFSKNDLAMAVLQRQIIRGSLIATYGFPWLTFRVLVLNNSLACNMMCRLLQQKQNIAVVHAWKYCSEKVLCGNIGCAIVAAN